MSTPANNSTLAADRVQVDDTSQYELSLEPPVGTSYFKEYTTTPYYYFYNQYPPFTWSPHVTIQFYIYVTLKRPDDSNFTKDGGKVYVIFKYRGKPGSYGSPDSFKLKVEDVSPTQLLSPVKVLPNEGQESKNGDVYTYSWNFRQTFSMFKSGGNDIQNFTAIDEENYTLTGWKQSPITGNTNMGYEFTKDNGASKHDDNPDINGIQVWEATSLGTATLRVTCSCDGFDDQSDTYDLDFSAGTMKNSSA